MLGLSGRGEIEIVNHGANRNVHRKQGAKTGHGKRKVQKNAGIAFFHKSLGIRAF
jgi:hypothetical protein